MYSKKTEKNNYVESDGEFPRAAGLSDADKIAEAEVRAGRNPGKCWFRPSTKLVNLPWYCSFNWLVRSDEILVGRLVMGRMRIER